MAEVTGTATVMLVTRSNVCAGCNRPLEKANAWMEDGCPCNTPKGVNDGNQLISDWRQDRIQELQREVAALKRKAETK